MSDALKTLLDACDALVSCDRNHIPMEDDIDAVVAAADAVRAELARRKLRVVRDAPN